MNIILMASGTGTNAVNLINYSKKLHNVKVVGVIVDRKSSALVSADLDVPVFLIEKQKTMNSVDHENEIIKKIQELHGEYILLCGYMRILSINFLKCFYDSKLNQFRVFNIHPSLLPKYKGAHGYQDAFDSGDLVSGVTVHFVDEGMDTGKIFKQLSFDRNEKDTYLDFVNKGKELEWKIYPLVLDWLETI